jgi:GPN-loop GTPase
MLTARDLFLLVMQVYCMEYLLDNVDWLKDELDNYDDDEYIIFDCPGQVELYRYVLALTEQSINYCCLY